MNPTPRRVLVTGASSGIGQHVARALVGSGWLVFAGARRADRLAALQAELGPNLVPIALDVTDGASIAAAAAAIHERTGGYGLDAVVNNAGVAIAGPMAEVEEADLRAQFETNVLGLVAVTRAFLPAMIARRSGRIVNVGSTAGRIGQPMVGAYHATKYAVEALSDAYRMELAPLGITVSLLEPGPVRTEFGDKLKASVDRVDPASPWAPVRANVAAVEKRAEGVMIGPEVIARDALHALTAARPRARYVAPRWFGPMLQLAALLPTWLLDRILSRMLGLHLLGGAPARA